MIAALSGLSARQAQQLQVLTSPPWVGIINPITHINTGYPVMIYGFCFGLDDIQFAYQSGVLTMMCSWAVIETVN